MVVIDGEEFVLGLRLEREVDVAAVSRCSACNQAIYYHPDLRDSTARRICTVCAAGKLGIEPLEGVAQLPKEKQMKLWKG